jgi:hypothetical protein
VIAALMMLKSPAAATVFDNDADPSWQTNAGSQV